MEVSKKITKEKPEDRCMWHPDTQPKDLKQEPRFTVTQLTMTKVQNQSTWLSLCQ